MQNISYGNPVDSMASMSDVTNQENQTDRCPLLMGRSECRQTNEHVIDIEGTGVPSTSPPLDNDSPCGLNRGHDDAGPSAGSVALAIPSPSSISNSSNSRSSSITRRGDGSVRRNPWRVLNTTLWIVIELLFTLGQIIAAVVVLSVSRHENPQIPLFAWIVGYAAGCIVTLPVLYLRYLHRNQVPGRRSTQFRHGSAHVHSPTEENSYMTISLTRPSDEACCICLTKYVDDDELRELPCSHFFHTECVDKWLKINASCPLCKYEIGGDHDDSHSPADPTPQV